MKTARIMTLFLLIMDKNWYLEPCENDQFHIHKYGPLKQIIRTGNGNLTHAYGPFRKTQNKHEEMSHEKSINESNICKVCQMNDLKVKYPCEPDVTRNMIIHSENGQCHGVVHGANAIEDPAFPFPAGDIRDYTVAQLEASLRKRQAELRRKEWAKKKRMKKP